MQHRRLVAFKDERPAAQGIKIEGLEFQLKEDVFAGAPQHSDAAEFGTLGLTIFVRE